MGSCHIKLLMQPKPFKMQEGYTHIVSSNSNFFYYELYFTQSLDILIPFSDHSNIIITGVFNEFEVPGVFRYLRIKTMDRCWGFL